MSEVVNDTQSQATPNAEQVAETKLQETFYGNAEANAETPVGDKQEAAPEKVDEVKPEADKTEKAEAEVKPLELKLPENALLGAEHLKDLEAFAKEKNLNQDQAQAILEREAKAVGDYVKAQEAAVEVLRTEWFEQCKVDKELGGEQFAAAAESAKRVVDRYATPEFKAILKETGYGNHPELLRVFSRIGKAMGEDKMVLSKAQIGNQKPLENIFYGDT